MDVEPAMRRYSFKRSLRTTDDVPTDLADALWHDPQDVFRQAKPLLEKAHRTTVLLTWQQSRFILKHYTDQSPIDVVKQSLRTSRARQAWQAGMRLLKWGINTPRPAALIENRFGWLHGDSYLMYPFIAGQPLDDYFASVGHTSPVSAANIARQFSAMWKQLLTHRVSLADPHLGNFIVDGQGKLWVIDLDHTKFHLHRFAVERKHDHCWRQMQRSAKRIGPAAQRFVAELQAELWRKPAPQPALVLGALGG